MLSSRRPWDGILKLLAASLLATLLAGAYIAVGTVHAQMPPALPDLAPPEGFPPELAPPEGFPPELAPPEGFPPELAPPEGFPPELAPPAGFPPDLAPPEGFPPAPPASALPVPPGGAPPISPDALPIPPGGAPPLSPDALPIPPGGAPPLSPDALPIPTDGSLPGTAPDAEADAEVAVDTDAVADEAAPATKAGVAGTGPAGLPNAGSGVRDNLDNWGAAAGITLLTVAGSLLTIGARMRRIV